MAGPVEWCSPDNHTCSFVSRPLIKAVCGNQAAASFYGITESRLLRSSLRHPIDGPESDGCVFRPIGDQSPTDQAKSALRLFPLLTDNGDLLTWGNVPAWGPVRILFETKMIAKVTLFRGEPIASAHGKPSLANGWTRQLFHSVSLRLSLSRQTCRWRVAQQATFARVWKTGIILLPG
jgi:hypothetical protein